MDQRFMLLRKLQANKAIAFALLFILIGSLIFLIPPYNFSGFRDAVATTLLASGLVTIGWNFLLDKWRVTELTEIVRDELARFRSNVMSELGCETGWTKLGMERIGLGGEVDAVIKNELENALAARLTCLFDTRWYEVGTKPFLTKFLDRPGTSLTVLVPDPNDNSLIEHLAARHGMTSPSFKGMVNTLLEEFEERRSNYPGKVILRTLKKSGPAYTSYLFESSNRPSIGVVRIYGHQMGRGTGLPELVAGPGLLLNYLVEDFESLKKRSVEVP